MRVRGLPAFAVKAIQCMFAFPFKDFKLSVFARSVELGAQGVATAGPSKLVGIASVRCVFGIAFARPDDPKSSGVPTPLMRMQALACDSILPASFGRGFAILTWVRLSFPLKQGFIDFFCSF